MRVILMLLLASVTFIPPILASIVIIEYVDLAPYERSAFGRYPERYMTKEMQAVRLVGYLIMALGAWHRRPWFISLGPLVVLFGWLRGKLFWWEGE